MARVARIVAVGYPHHITQRGNNRKRTFLNESDYKRYLSFVTEYSRQYRLDLISYCLMPNHVHFIGIPKEEYSLAKTFDVAHMRYAQYFNKKTDSSGHLWQGRFYSCILDDPHLFTAVRYIERNPVRAGIVKEAWDWQWSSARYHIGIEKVSLVTKGNFFDYIKVSQKEWINYLRMNDDDKFVDEFRKYTKRGRPFGKEQFIRRLELSIGRALRLFPRGRPWRRK